MWSYTARRKTELTEKCLSPVRGRGGWLPFRVSHSLRPKLSKNSRGQPENLVSER